MIFLTIIVPRSAVQPRKPVRIKISFPRGSLPYTYRSQLKKSLSNLGLNEIGFYFFAIATQIRKRTIEIMKGDVVYRCLTDVVPKSDVVGLNAYRENKIYNSASLPGHFRLW